MEKMSASASECAWQVARYLCVGWQRKKIETKTRKKFFGVEVCAPGFARVGVQQKIAGEHRERGNQVAESVELANNLQVAAGCCRQVAVAMQVVAVVARSQGTQVNFGWQQNRVLAY